LEQIHATVIGLERRTQSGFENRNFHAFRGCSKARRQTGATLRFTGRGGGIVAKRFVVRYMLAEAGHHRIDAVVAAPLA
jgi:hypothetical protein